MEIGMQMTKRTAWRGCDKHSNPRQPHKRCPHYNTLMICFLNKATHHKRTKQKENPVGSPYLADTHDVGEDMMMASLLHMTNHHNKTEKHRLENNQGLLYLANIHGVGGNMLMTSLLHMINHQK